MCIVSLSSLATWATRSYSAWQRTFHCKRGETDRGNTQWDERGQKQRLGVIVNNCIQATANRNRIKIRNNVRNVKRWTVGTGEMASKFKLQAKAVWNLETEHEARVRQADSERGLKDRRRQKDIQSLNSWTKSLTSKTASASTRGSSTAG